MVERTFQDLAEELGRRGYVVFPALYDRAFVDAATQGLRDVYAAAGTPALCQEGFNETALEGAAVSSSGLQIGSGLLDFAPTITHRFLHPTIDGFLQHLLGADFAVDVVGGCVSDETRARKPWHHHCGGPDEDTPDAISTPVGEAAMRVNLLVYLTDVGPGGGQLLVHPRTIQDPVEPAGPFREDWPDQQALTWQAGTAMILDERTWHGVWPQTSQGKRLFVGGYFRSQRLQAPKRADPRAEDVRERSR